MEETKWKERNGGNVLREEGERRERNRKGGSARKGRERMGEMAPIDRTPVPKDPEEAEPHEIHVAQIYRSKARGEHSMEQLFAALDPWFSKENAADRVAGQADGQGDPHTQKGSGSREDLQTQTAYGYQKERYPQGGSRYRIAIRKYTLPEPRYHSLSALYRNLRYVRKVAFRDHPDVYHITGEVTFLGCILKGKRTVLTLHDFVYLDRFRKGKEESWQSGEDGNTAKRNNAQEIWDEGWEEEEGGNNRNEGKPEEVLPGSRAAIGTEAGNQQIFHKRHAFREIRYLVSYWFWYRIPLTRCRRVVCVSHTVREELLSRFPMIPKEKITVIPNTLGEAYEEERTRQLQDCGRNSQERHEGNKNMETQDGQRHGEDRG